MNPLTDNDTHDVIDDAIAALAARRQQWLGDDLTIIGLIADLIAQAERELPLLVASARTEGATWTDIARRLNTSPHEAQLRFDPDSPVADTRWPIDT